MPVCLALLAVLLMTACAPARPVATDDSGTAPLNLLLVTLDTFRADRLGPRLTPALDRLAAAGLRFTDARTVAPLTLPAHVSIMTGLRPPLHGARLNGAVYANRADTLATRLQRAGYRTGAVVGAFVLDRRFGLAVGFDDYDDDIARDPAAMDTLHAERPAGAVIERALLMLARRTGPAPWLQWVHLYDTHAPYAPPPAALARAGGVAYDGEVVAVDDAVARLLAAVAARADAPRTAVVVVGDHGESLGAHDEATHGMLVTEPAIRVPLVVRVPGIAPATRRDAASVIDVAPTLLALAGQAVRDLDGRNLLAPSPGDVSSYAESEYPAVAAWAPVSTVVRGSWKLVVADRPRLFDLAADAEEQRDLAAQEPARARELTAALQVIRRRVSAPGDSGVISADTARQLRALGYVTATTPRASAAAPVAAVTRDWSAFEAALTDSRTGRHAQALPVLASLVAAHPDAPIFASTYARALADSGQTRAALTRFRAAVARFSGDWSLLHELSAVARAAGLTAEAGRAEAAALALSPNEPSALNGRGLLFADAGAHADAAQAFARAVAGDPTNVSYQANLGNALRATGDLDGAATAYRRALQRAPHLGDAANGLGVVLVQQQRAAEALPWLEQAARDPAFIEAQLNFGIALQQAGQRERAVTQYRKVAAMPAPSREREAARALLDQMGPR